MKLFLNKVVQAVFYKNIDELMIYIKCKNSKMKDIKLTKLWYSCNRL